MKRGSNPQSDSESESTSIDPNPKPQPPVDAPRYAVEPLAAQHSGLLREIGQYALELAEWKADARAAELAAEDRGHETPDEWDDDEWEAAVDDAYEDVEIVQPNGSITINQIDGRGYYYLKWSENGEFKSKYIAPVEPKERGKSN